MGSQRLLQRPLSASPVKPAPHCPKCAPRDAHGRISITIGPPTAPAALLLMQRESLDYYAARSRART